jgi:hypothetical protein
MKTSSTDGTKPKSNIVPIPDPVKLLDPLYLIAHTLIDQLPRSALAALLPTLERAAGAWYSPANSQAPPPSTSPSTQSATGCDRLN